MAILSHPKKKEIETTRRTELATADKKAISIALDEIYDGSVAPSDLND